MIGYVTIGSNDIDKACEFYGALLAEIGGKQLMPEGRIRFFGKSMAEPPMIAVCIPYDEQPATVGNGVMVAIPGGSKAGVDSLYAKAVELGATDDGAPGDRVPGVFYGAYVRDLDGNKLCFFDMTVG